MRIIDAILVVVSIVAFIGGVVAAYVFVQVGRALDLIQSSAVNTAISSQAVNTFNLVLTLGWVWIIAVLISSGYAIWVGIQRIRNK